MLNNTHYYGNKSSTDDTIMNTMYKTGKNNSSDLYFFIILLPVILAGLIIYHSFNKEDCKCNRYNQIDQHKVRFSKTKTIFTYRQCKEDNDEKHIYQIPVSNTTQIEAPRPTTELKEVHTEQNLENNILNI